MEVLQEHYGKTIVSIDLLNYDNQEDIVFIYMHPSEKVQIWDDGQDCCEKRYITTDDDTESLAGQTLVAVKIKKAADIPGDDEVHEVAFLEIVGNLSSIVFETHNEHNGYYGGFSIATKVEL